VSLVCEGGTGIRSDSPLLTCEVMVFSGGGPARRLLRVRENSLETGPTVVRAADSGGGHGDSQSYGHGAARTSALVPRRGRERGESKISIGTICGTPRVPSHDGGRRHPCGSGSTRPQSIAMTVRYSRLAPDFMADAVEKLFREATSEAPNSTDTRTDTEAIASIEHASKSVH